MDKSYRIIRIIVHIYSRIENIRFVSRHAGVWTLEEALKVCRDKMIRKRSLYLEQYKRLHVLLKKRKQCHLMRMATAGYHSGEDQGTFYGIDLATQWFKVI